MAEITRHSALEERHRALGSTLDGEWNGMPLPQTYATDPDDEVVAVRTKAGLFDVTALRMIDVRGSDSVRALNHMLTSNVAKLKPGQSAISNIVDANGSLIDDVLVYRDAPDIFRLSHGGGDLENVIATFFDGLDASWEKNDDVHILSLQGPSSLATLNPHTSFDLSRLSYFEHAETLLFDTPVSIGRGGYSAELGFEVFCRRADAVAMWDAILAAGAPFDVIPVSWACLDIVRVEGALLFFPFDMPEGDTSPFEVGAEWTIDLDKPDFYGKSALLKRKAEIRCAQVGLEIDATIAIEPGARLVKDGETIGTVNSTTYSRYLMKSLALGHVVPQAAAPGTAIQVVSAAGEFAAHVVRTPFYDPLRLRTHPLHERQMP
ncbi:aminomethyltransferase family protein [Jiella sp. MQZ9-1]|uniref:Aminomethyltransferase family protein n=1 Tax=Jiella flava TaxID=2816857 RepID=A0A939G2F4_9HYPH|nr:aminomethyltransferase family protein [Jiella flava]MBO0663977.1 aminomethyltransferase family protein [Jiella flava]MCD2472548.1 aminomethyltransferase family protein [Jiella flava]